MHQDLAEDTSAPATATAGMIGRPAATLATVANQMAAIEQERLRTAILRLADARRAVIVTAGVVHERKAAWHVANADVIEAALKADAEQRTADNELRLLAGAFYQATGEKKPGPGLEVKVGAEFAFDGDLCLAFAKATSIGYVPETYDARALSAVAKTKLKDDGSTQVPGITWIEKATVNVASDLDKALAAAALIAAPAAGAPVGA